MAPLRVVFLQGCHGDQGAGGSRGMVRPDHIYESNWSKHSCLSVSDDGPPACGWVYCTLVHPRTNSACSWVLEVPTPLCPGPPGQIAPDARFWLCAVECAA